MKNRVRLMLVIFLAFSILLSMASCGNKAHDLSTVASDLEALGASVVDNTVILSHDSVEKQGAQWGYLVDNFEELEHAQLQVIGEVFSHSVVATISDASFLYLRLPNHDPKDTSTPAIPVVFSKELFKAFMDQHSDFGLFIPDGTLVELKGTLEMYENFRGSSASWADCPVFMITSIELCNTPVAV